MKRRDALRMMGLGAALAPLANAESAGWLEAATDKPGPRVPVCYSPAYVGATLLSTPRARRAWVAESLAQRASRAASWSPHSPLTAAQVERVHDPAYVQAVGTGEPRALAESQGFAWDPQLWPMVLASNGGAVAAARAAPASSASPAHSSSGLHHARYGRGAGFCTFNGLAIAALAAGTRRAAYWCSTSTPTAAAAPIADRSASGVRIARYRGRCL